jgi:hypothetical protein
MIYCVGCNHRIQQTDADPLFDTPEVPNQKASFTQLLEDVIRQGGIEFVGEEWGLSKKTIAHALADDHRIPWCDINTCFHDLDGLEIPRDYVLGEFSEAQKNQWHRQRELIMLRRLREGAGNAENILVVCGLDHMDPLTDLFRHDLVAPVAAWHI